MSIFLLSDQEIREHISKNLGIRHDEKDKYGEVFTSSNLIDELLDNLPASVWKNPDNLWLDPAAGTGNFPALIYSRLFVGLEKEIPDIKVRKTHIITKMLYMVELNEKNVQDLRKLFGKRANISCSNFLDEKDKWISDLGKSSFDIVVGNPPFQSQKDSKYEGSSGNRTLWDKFLESILKHDVLNKDGRLAFITPSNWRRPEHPIYQLLTRENTLEYIHIYGKKDGVRLLGAQTRFDLYVVQEGSQSTDKKTAIIDEKGVRHDVDVHSWPFLPNFAFSKIKPLLVSADKGVQVVFSAGNYDARKLSKTRTMKKKYPIVHNITQKGLGVRYASDRVPTQFGIPKVLLNFNERQYPYNDYRGEYGMSQLTFGIPIKSKKEGEEWIAAIESHAFEEIIRATKWGAFQTDYRMFKYFDPKIYQKSTFRKTKRQH